MIGDKKTDMIFAKEVELKFFQRKRFTKIFKKIN